MISAHGRSRTCTRARWWAISQHRDDVARKTCSDVSGMPLLRRICNAYSSVRFVKKSSGGSRRRGVGCGLLFFFHFKIVHSSAFSYTNSKVLFYLQSNAGKGTLPWYSWRLTVIQIWKRQVFINLVNPAPLVISNSRRFHSYSRHVLWA